MRELFVDAAVLSDEQGREHRYEYHIVIDEMDVGRFACESYGLRVREQGNGASCTVPNITCSIARIDELCALAVRGGVTPSTLRDVVEDWL